MRVLSVHAERFAIRGAFTISRGSRTHAEVVQVVIGDGEHEGQGECTPYARYGETTDGVIETVKSIAGDIESGAGTNDLQRLLPAGAARNAVDCALWDLACKQSGQPAHQLLALDAPRSLTTAYTLSLADPETLAREAWENRHRPLLKIKLGGQGDPDRMRAVMGHCGDAKVIVDANEAWAEDVLWDWLELAAELGIALVEQPLASGNDRILRDRARPLPVCADESCHDAVSLKALAGLYDVVNIKLDKTGGLTEAIRTKREAKERGFGIFVGCMMGSSLAMAPAFLLGADADFVDLDAPLLLSEDRDPAMRFSGSVIEPPPPALWG